MNKHTPGPWHRNIKPASRYPVIFTGRNTHVVTAVPARGIPDDEAEANHDLLVAAPNLLEALQWLIDELGDPAAPQPPSVEAMDAAFKALAEVKGAAT